MRVADFSNEQLAGQRLMVGFEGTGLNPELRHVIETLKVGGVILFAVNLQNPEQIRRLCADIQDCARQCGQPPLFIAVDQEGGDVARLRDPFTEFPGNPRMRGTADADRFAHVTARELTGVGINMNMAPVLDVADPSLPSVMSGRAFGTEAKWVTRLGMTVIEVQQRNGLMAVAKHFPGIGRTVLDSHQDLPRCEAAEAQLAATDWVPFESAVAHPVDGMMLSHILYPSLDPRWPASLSVRIARDLLRGRMHYEGVVMTDDFDMGAIARHYDIATVMARVLAADIDMALICHRGPNIRKGFDEILAAMGDDGLRRAGCRSVTRILDLKHRYLGDWGVQWQWDPQQLESAQGS